MSEKIREASQLDWIEETVDRTTSSVEGIHKSIAAVPLDLMRQAGILTRTADDVSDIQDRSISAVYATVRDVNHRVMGLAAELLGSSEPESSTPEA